MIVERRFLIASSLARLIQRESGVPIRIVEGHFVPQADRTQLVRVELDRASLVLVNQDTEAAGAEESVEVPRAHAEAMMDVAAGTVAFDRVPVRLGKGVEAVLDRFILPQGVDVLTVRINSNPRAFAPPLWAGMEVTGDHRFGTSGLALNGPPALEQPDISSTAVEALLDTLEG